MKIGRLTETAEMSLYQPQGFLVRRRSACKVETVTRLGSHLLESQPTLKCDQVRLEGLLRRFVAEDVGRLRIAGKLDGRVARNLRIELDNGRFPAFIEQLLEDRLGATFVRQ